MSDGQEAQLPEEPIAEAVITPEQQWEQSQFSAGFTGQPADSPEPEEPKVTMASLTEEQLQGMLAKISEVDALRSELHSTRDGLFGKFGELNRTVKEAKKAPATVKFSADQFKKLGQEYPELAQSLAEDLSGLWPTVDETEIAREDKTINAPADPEALRQEFDLKLERSVAKITMDFKRPGWLEDIQSQEFSNFKGEMSPADRSEFDASWDPTYVAGTLEKFDKWKEKNNSTLEKNTQISDRLKNNIQPRGTTPDHTPSDVDAFSAGFRAVRGK